MKLGQFSPMWLRGKVAARSPDLWLTLFLSTFLGKEVVELVLLIPTQSIL